MKLSTKPFQDALARLAPVAGGKMTLPILSTVRMATALDRLTLTANNLDACLTATILIEGDEFFPETCVDLKSLIAAANTPADELELTLGQNILTVKGTGTCVLGTLDPKEFPATPEDKFVEIGCNGEDMAEMIRGAGWCAIESPSDIMLEAVRVKTSAKLIEVMSFDRKQFCLGSRASICAESDVLIPHKFTPLIADVLAQDGGSFHVGERFVKASSDGVSVMAKRMEGAWFNITAKDLNNPKLKVIGKIEAKPFLSVLETCRALSAGEPFFDVNIAASDKGLWIGFKGKRNQFETTLAGKYEPAEFTLSGDRIMDMLRHCEDVATMSFDGERTVKFEHDDFSSFLAILKR